MKKIFTLLCGAAVAMSASAYDVVTFEDQTLGANEAFVSSDEDAIISGDFFFPYYGAVGYWNGVTVSNKTANTFTDLSDQYNACTGVGAEGSATFAVAYYAQYNALMDDQYPEIWSNKADTFFPEYVYVTNTAYAATSMENGDSYAKKFDESDYLKIIFKSVDEDDEEVARVEFFLAKDGKIVKDWQKVDLRPLGEVEFIRIEMESTDMSYGFINTPTYFAFDNFKASEDTPTGISEIKVSNNKAYKTIENGQVVIVNGNNRYDITGRMIK